jgi:acetyltransferase
MTIRNLDALFQPKAIALIGASNEPNSVGAVLARNLFETGFQGPILTVNPHERAIRSALNYRSVAELPLAPDLAVIATPPAPVPGLIAELGARGCRAAVVVTAGFGEGDKVKGKEMRQAMLSAAKPHLLRIVGPNCLGFISPAAGINASFAHLTPPAGDLAFLTQSGALATAILDWAAARRIGFSHVVSLGDMNDVDFGDLLDYLALDQKTRAVLLYVESITAARKFMSAGRIAARAKPVIVVKAGRSAAGAKAALSHTGSLAGADAVYDAAFRRAGMLRVYSLRELFEAAMTLAAGLKPEGARLAILTNGGGAGVLATDALEDVGGDLAEISRETVAELDKLLPATWSHANPVDILGDATGRRYADALGVLVRDPAADAILVMNCPTAVAGSREAAEAVLAAMPERGKPVLACWLGETAAREARQLLAAHRVPAYEAPDEAVRALMHLVQYRRNQQLLMETPPASPAVPSPNRDAARIVAANVLDEGRTTLTEPEAKELLARYGIPTVTTFTAESPADAARIAARLGRPVALKILSPDITHKSDVGGVHLDLHSPAAVEKAASAMLAQVRERVSTARIAGFTVQEMVQRPRDIELILGIAEDSLFGPVVMFGQGGVAVEVIADRAIGLPPLNMVLAREMIARTRVAKLLAGFRDRPPADVAAVALTLVRLSELLVDLSEIVELDINPLLAGADGVLALDARVVVRPLDPTRPRVLAIQPYPAGLEHDVEIDGGKRLLVRPIRPEDEPRLVEMVARSSPEDVRLRFLGALKEFPHLTAARLSQIDYDREMALVAIDPEEPTQGEILGVSRIVADPENEKAEYAVMVRSDLKGRGLGFQLMKDILAYARRRGIKTVHGDVLTENRTMLQMAAELGFVREESERGVVRVALNL